MENSNMNFSYFIVNGDVLQAKEDIICHQVNCLGKMGAGLALQIKKQFPYVYQLYKEKCDRNTGTYLLGQTLLVKVLTYAGKEKYIANLFGQFETSTSHKATNYEGLYKALINLKNSIDNLESNPKNQGKKYSLAFPYLIGCALGGGDWTIVLPMILTVFPDRQITFYKLEP